MKAFASLALTARHETRRLLGASGAAGIALLIVAMLLSGYAAPAWQARQHALQNESLRLAEEWKARPAAGPGPLAPAEQIRRFHDWFPPATQTVDDLRLVAEQAQAHKVALDKGEYQMQRDAGNPLLAYDVVLPVKASYPALRGFVGAVLNAAPHAALAELRMERPNARNTTLDARIHFRFTYRDK
ncbi:hypothetical protein [Noviherbaspirillum pedocola]|uniref:Uncharacterized protein n=1 Tax=Noviherbaspirillum pedocola TaxID=2801341 RepID=A0A934W8H1_9BURK|nr:hypothetical protein [Noviherbaspirillum pedocola]MBK4735819.1 hypothetical protein [Noviherbaspirillum pedocola]